MSCICSVWNASCVEERRNSDVGFGTTEEERRGPDFEACPAQRPDADLGFGAIRRTPRSRLSGCRFHSKPLFSRSFLGRWQCQGDCSFSCVTQLKQADFHRTASADVVVVGAPWVHHRQQQLPIMWVGNAVDDTFCWVFHRPLHLSLFQRGLSSSGFNLVARGTDGFLGTHTRVDHASALLVAYQVTHGDPVRRNQRESGLSQHTVTSISLMVCSIIERFQTADYGASQGTFQHGQ